ncbi:hypothetical protein HHK36_004820 [Tetracentron sinense]|uniref:CCHC-type domain-containing protein n=1 Tax=Tetracentron sinense TaxID=13715 RepID=A0A835DQJ1_TETSI|nr:hypothetical protein HHK36_004820 [Tetracentron sinense]
MDPEAAQTARESLELAFQMSNILDTGLDRYTLSILISLCDLGLNPEPLAALVKELQGPTPTVPSRTGGDLGDESGVDHSEESLLEGDVGNPFYEDDEIEEYTVAFNNLCLHNGLARSEEIITSQYLSGLRLQIRKHLVSTQVWRVDEAFQLALWVEEHLKKRSMTERRGGTLGSKGFGAVCSTQSTGLTRNQSWPSAGSALKAVGPGFDKDKGEVSLKGRSGGLGQRFFTCGEPGHRLYECPKR